MPRQSHRRVLRTSLRNPLSFLKSGSEQTHGSAGFPHLPRGPAAKGTLCWLSLAETAEAVLTILRSAHSRGSGGRPQRAGPAKAPGSARSATGVVSQSRKGRAWRGGHEPWDGCSTGPWGEVAQSAGLQDTLVCTEGLLEVRKSRFRGGGGSGARTRPARNVGELRGTRLHGEFFLEAPGARPSLAGTAGAGVRTRRGREAHAPRLGAPVMTQTRNKAHRRCYGPRILYLLSQGVIHREDCAELVTEHRVRHDPVHTRLGAHARALTRMSTRTAGTGLGDHQSGQGGGFQYILQ